MRGRKPDGRSGVISVQVKWKTTVPEFRKRKGSPQWRLRAMSKNREEWCLRSQMLKVFRKDGLCNCAKHC